MVSFPHGSMVATGQGSVRVPMAYTMLCIYVYSDPDGSCMEHITNTAICQDTRSMLTIWGWIEPSVIRAKYDASWWAGGSEELDRIRRTESY